MPGRPIRLDKLVIDFKLTAPSRLFWAGRPAMRIVQTLHWLHDMLPIDDDSILKKITRILDDAKQGRAIRHDLRSGLDALPAWMPRAAGSDHQSTVQGAAHAHDRLAVHQPG
jgi:hypothetical protein